MEKINSFRHGRVWLNVFMDEHGELLLTISKSYRKDGKWKSTSFLRPSENDINGVIQVVGKFLEANEAKKAVGWCA